MVSLYITNTNNNKSRLCLSLKKTFICTRRHRNTNFLTLRKEH